IYLQGTAGPVTLLSTSEAEGLGLIELTELENETLSLVEDEAVPSGSYGQLRFVIDRAVLEAGGSFYSYNGAVPPTAGEGFQADGDLVCPSCSQTGIKALLPQDELPVEGDQKVIVLDFDVSRSFGQDAGTSGMWVMTPIIVATDLGFTGGITGTVSLGDGVSIPQCPEGTDRDITVFQATATAQTLDDESGDDVVYTDHPDTEGNLAFDFLDPDTYELGYDSPIQVADGWELRFTADFSPTSVDVTSGDQTTGVAYTIDSAVCEEISS
ncbi:MAG: DUF4382 domain-containing protein, partial [Longimicrobiales bacterium]